MSQSILKISPEAYTEISNILKFAGYTNRFHEHDDLGIVIDMTGITISTEKETACKNPCLHPNNFRVIKYGPDGDPFIFCNKCHYVIGD
jgi:hypothetical protein